MDTVKLLSSDCVVRQKIVHLCCKGTNPSVHQLDLSINFEVGHFMQSSPHEK